MQDVIQARLILLEYVIQFMNFMETRKLISLRIDSETCNKLDEIAKYLHYYKRSAVINGILDAVVDSLSKDEVGHLVRYWRKDEDTKPTIIVTPAKKYQKR